MTVTDLAHVMRASDPIWLLALSFIGAAAAIGLVRTVKELRRVRRRMAMAREIANARRGTTHFDPGVHRAFHPRSVPTGAPTPGARHVPRLVEFRQELAARGKALDDLRVEDR